jgi:hypothetical protein
MPFGIAFYESNLAGEEEQLEPIANSAEQPGLDLPWLREHQPGLQQVRPHRPQGSQIL